MKTNLIFGLCIIVLLLISGCQTYYSVGIVQHKDSLEEAHEKCVKLCKIDNINHATPKLNECTAKECECLC